MKLERFESAQGPDYSKLDFDQQQDELHANMLRVQMACRKAGIPIVVLVSGVEGAGKSAVVNRLSKWLDMRNVRTISYWGESDDEKYRPRDWRFWRDLPGKGEISILFGSWYTHPIVKAATRMKSQKKVDAYLKEECRHINQFEKLLSDDGVVFVKMWFHISRKEQTARIKAKQKAGFRVTPYEKALSKSYDRFAQISDQVIGQTETKIGHWHVIDSKNKRSRDLRAGRILLEHMHRALESNTVPITGDFKFKHARPKLAHINLNKSLTEKEYKKELDKYQAKLADLHWAAWEQKRSTVLLFEGSDAAGKGGAIRRLTGAMDARLYRVIPVAAPTDEEKAHHYLWRFWRHLPQDGNVTIYDRSWYGRVLVERVEGFAREDEWQRAYDEINDFECQLSNHGIIVAKFWLTISAEEQLRRFKLREVTEHKKHKLTEEDWRNREKWDAYAQAVDDFLGKTDKPNAPWYVIPANDKLYARVQVIKKVCTQMEKALD